jgi:hypothetical protein
MTGKLIVGRVPYRAAFPSQQRIMPLTVSWTYLLRIAQSPTAMRVKQTFIQHLLTPFIQSVLAAGYLTYQAAARVSSGCGQKPASACQEQIGR